MENKMTQEQGEKIKALEHEINELQLQINSKDYEIEKIIVEAGANFEGSYVEFYDGEEYVFMKVERQILRSNGRTINLQGPSIRLNDNPLHESYDEYDGFDWGSYDESDGFSFGSKVLQELTVETVRKISKKDMTFVLDYYINTMKKKLI